MAEAKEEKKGGIFQKLIDALSGGGDSEREKKRLLKEIAKNLKKQKNRFYKPKSSEALPGLAQYFHSLYKLLSPAQVFLENASKSGALKNLVIEYFLTDEQKVQLEKFDEEKIRDLAERQDMKKVTADLKEDLVSFFSAFDNAKVKEINAAYNMIQIFLQLVHFDYYFLLKKFDSSLPERNFSYNPKFDTITGSYISEDLKDFLSVLHLIDTEADWNTVFDILEIYKGQEVITRSDWTKNLKNLKSVRRSSILAMIVQHIDEDPYYKVVIFPPKERIVESYLTKIKSQAEMIVQKLIQEKRNSKIDKFTVAIFGTPAVSRLKYYTEKANEAFSKKMLGGFTHIQPLNYLKAFLLDFIKRDVKNTVDILLVKGKWSTNIVSQQLSDSFHQLLEYSDELIAFDDTLADEGSAGSRIKTLLSKADRDPNSMSSLKQLLKDTNESAYAILKKASGNIIAVGKYFKACLEDYEKTAHELLVNWKELEGYFDNNLKESLLDVYKKLYYFMQLMQFFIKK